MKQTQTSSPIGEESTSPVDTARPSRRRLLAGGVAAPLLMTITSRPAWAQGGMCTPSALASANVSGQHSFEGCGISAGWWKNSKDRWPVPHTTPFHTVFQKVKYKDKVVFQKPNGMSMTLGEVISLENERDNPGNLAMPLIGAYLNALSFPTQGGQPGYPYMPQQIVDAFNSLHNKSKSEFENLKNTLDAANNQYDGITAKP